MLTPQQIAAMRQALEAANSMYIEGFTMDNSPISTIITALTAALEQPAQESDDLTIAYMAGLYDGKKSAQPAQQEPVAHCEAGPEYCPVCHKELNPEPAIYPDEAYEMGLEEVAFYTSPQPSKSWVGLTQQDINIAFDDTQEGGGFDDFARAIEAKLREKNAQPIKPLTDERIESVRHMRDVQGYDGNWNYDPYMQGLYNGLEFALSLLEGREPQFKDAPEVWLGDVNFKRDEPSIEAAHGIKEQP